MRKRVILAARTDTDDPNAAARGHIEAQESVDLVERLAAALHADGRVRPVVVPHPLNLTDQILWINERFPSRDAGIAIEIHKGKHPRGTSGVEAWVATGDRLGRLFTAAVLRELARSADLPDRGVREGTAGEPGERWLRRTRPMAAQVACGYMGRDHFENERYAAGLQRGLLAAFGALAIRAGKTGRRVQG